jgi:hypothetical protein
MSNEANLEHFEGIVDPSDTVKGGQFLQAARIVAGEAKSERGAFTFTGRQPAGGEPGIVLEIGGRYERVGNTIRVFFNNPPNHSVDVPLGGLK